jgi:hypothetical protein
MHSLRLLGIGIFFALAGIGLCALTLKKAPPTAAPLKKSEERQAAIEQSNTLKMRIAGVILAVAGAAVMLIS